MDLPASTIDSSKRTRFDEKKAYVPQEEQGKAFVSPTVHVLTRLADSKPQFDDGREVELLHFVYGHPSIDEIRGSPQKVLGAIDEYGRTKKYLMNVGDDKGKIVSDLIAEVKPQVMVELGGYIGYSALLFADAMRKAGGKKYFSLERNPEFGAVIMALVDLAGLSDVVKVVIGSSADSIRLLHSRGNLEHIDLMFLDHWKPAYLSDLKLCEHLDLVTPGTVLAADNVIKPGNPPYLEYVRSSVEKKKKAYDSDRSNGIDVKSSFGRNADMYKEREGEEKISTEAKGNPNLVYESELVHSYEPTGDPDGIEVTRCVGRSD
ncbi:MAG: hypothetical protein LQ352_007078 [Teloschistes flavicans]|nr:MAG: hypothetical protein LQ352_007078 [Teloschistes flavicans]